MAYSAMSQTSMVGYLKFKIYTAHDLKTLQRTNFTKYVTKNLN